MKLIKMKYKDYEFSVNPSSIKLEHSKSIATQKILKQTQKCEIMSVKPITIIGSGIIFGDDMLQKIKQIEILFDKKSSGYLFLPSLSPVKAFFSDLDFNIDSNKNLISYSFKFIEDCGDKDIYYNFGYTIAKNGENMYDIANRLNVEVEKLFENNDFEDLFSVQEGDKVYYA